MEIASLVIRAHPERIAAVRAAFARLPGVEVAACASDGRLVVTAEDRPGAALEKTLLDIHQVQGVLCATLVYQYSDAIPQELEATP